MQQFGILEKTLAVKMAVVTLVAVIVPYYLAGAAVDYLQSQIGKQQSLQAELNDVRAKRRDITTQKRLLDNHLESYQQWLARGVIAENADTTKWRNVMYDIKQKRGLGVINFDFGASKRMPPEESIYTKDSTASIAMLPMRISMPMLHDMDMFMFLGDLSNRAAGVFFPVSCRMTRLEQGFAAVVRDNIKGECEVVWVFMQDPDRIVS